MALPPSGTTEQAFLREVDEEFRRDQLLGIWQRYGRLIAGVIVVGLLALAAWLYFGHRSTEAAAKRGEEYDAAMRELEGGAAAKAAPVLDKLAKGDDGYAAAVLMAQGDQLLQKGDAKGAAAKFAQVAGNGDFGQPQRDLALLRQTSVEFDSLKPEVVIDRLKGLASPNSPWFGSAGEMTAAALIKQGKKAEAGRLLAQIAQAGETVPESIRQRAVQLAGVLGVEAGQAQENKAQ